MTSYKEIQAYDDRRDIIVPGAYEQTLEFCADLFIEIANKAIEDHGYFAVALSGGSTPKGIFTHLASEKKRSRVNWEKVLLFWSDERAVPPDHPDSNYKMAMEYGFKALKVPSQNIFRMVAEINLVENAFIYEKLIKDKINGVFDLVMLGMGNDAHTASLFPLTHALHPQEDRLVVANFVPQQNAWRMTLTFECINRSKAIHIYVLGSGKSKTVKNVFLHPYDPDSFPIQKIGTSDHKALWILDTDTAADLL